MKMTCKKVKADPTQYSSVVEVLRVRCTNETLRMSCARSLRSADGSQSPGPTIGERMIDEDKEVFLLPLVRSSHCPTRGGGKRNRGNGVPRLGEDGKRRGLLERAWKLEGRWLLGTVSV